MFQLTHPRRVRQMFGAGNEPPTKVSTHAPTKGATITIENSNESTFVSTHAPMRGATAIADAQQQAGMFQSTHPRRVRLKMPWRTEGRPLFQSTHPRRVRPRDACYHIGESAVSIHAPTKGATKGRCRRSRPLMFQSTHPRRVRLLIQVVRR